MASFSTPTPAPGNDNSNPVSHGVKREADVTRPLEGPLSHEKAQLSLHDPIALSAATAVSLVATEMLRKAGVESITAAEIAAIYRSITPPPRPELGDMAIPCFTLSKLLRKSPAAVAAEITAQLKTEAVGQFTNNGPYVNVRVSEELYHRYAVGEALSGAMFHRQFLRTGPVTMFEFSQPNTHKELHVGHMRNICLGDALSKVARYVGMPVQTATFPGDLGTHVAKTLWYLKFRNDQPVPDRDRGSWLGKMYSEATRQLETESTGPQADTNKEVLSTILRQIEEKKGEYYDLWRETRQWSIELLKEGYRWANVNFDKWYWESEVDSPSLELVKKLAKDGKLTKSNGALGVDLTAQGLGFCLLLKSDGNGLYATKDLLLAYQKFEDMKLDKSVYLVDERQSHHFKQVFAALGVLGFEHAKDCYHLAYNYVELPSGAMSSRKGNIVALTALTSSMEAMVTEKFLQRHVGTWTSEELKDAAHKISQAAIKFGMNQIEPNSKIVFEMDKWLQLDGDSGPYVQYACARIRSLIRKSGINLEGMRYNPELLTSPLERNLMVTMNRFNDVVVRVVESMKTNLLCDYLCELSRQFNGYYAQEKIVLEDSPGLTAARIALSASVEKVLTKGLSLLGIEVPPRM